MPIVPAAILFDLLNGGDKAWGETPPYAALGRAAYAAAGETFALGSVGAGTGATTANLKGGLGSASARLAGGVTVAALVAVNAVGQATIGDRGPFLGRSVRGRRRVRRPRSAGTASGRAQRASGTRRRRASAKAPPSRVVATDAPLTKAQAKRLAVMAHDGFARALWPSHTPLDGDLSLRWQPVAPPPRRRSA